MVCDGLRLGLAVCGDGLILARVSSVVMNRLGVRARCIGLYIIYLHSTKSDY